MNNLGENITVNQSGCFRGPPSPACSLYVPIMNAKGKNMAKIDGDTSRSPHDIPQT